MAHAVCDAKTSAPGPEDVDEPMTYIANCFAAVRRMNDPRDINQPLWSANIRSAELS
jgi:hypothetical protein